jgi:hypothetical protein
MNDSERSCLNDPELGWTFLNLGEHEHELERSLRFMNLHEQCSRMTFWMSGIVYYAFTLYILNNRKI